MKTTFNLFAMSLLLASATSVLADVHYVDVNSANATPPYTNWATAATNIQDAVDAAVAGDHVLVTNGTYIMGWRMLDMTPTHVVVDKSLNVASVSGPRFTIIDGGGGRCVYLTNGASLSGFTLTHGWVEFDVGGGVLCESTNAVVSNCVVTGNTAINGYAAGAYGGTLNDCILSTNDGGGAAYATLNNCVLNGNWLRGSHGGGAYGCTLNNCALAGNFVTNDFYADSYGGGADSCTLNNCTLTGNVVSPGAPNPVTGGRSAAYGGGAFNCSLNNCTLTRNNLEGYGFGAGAYGCTLNNCTLTRNSAGNLNGYGFGAGAYGSTLSNCIAYFNTIYHSFEPDHVDNYDASSLSYCCTTPQPTNGIGNITNAPLFVDTNAWADLRLQSNSPCINAGNNAYAPAGPDLDGNPRIVGGTVDIGAYEFQSPVSQISYAWLQHYGLSISISTDTADPDGDAVDNYHEWLAGTDPTNPLSSPAQLTITPFGVPPSGIILTWSTNAVGFRLQSATNLFSSATWVTSSPAPVVVNGQNTVTNPIIRAQQFYRLIQ